MEVGHNEKKEYGKGGIKKRRDRIEEQEIRNLFLICFTFLLLLSRICPRSVLCLFCQPISLKILGVLANSL